MRADTSIAPIAAVLLLGSVSVGVAEFSIVEPGTTGSFSIEAFNREQLAESSVFSPTAGLEGLEGEELIAALRGLHLLSWGGKPLKTFAIDKQSKLVVAVTQEVSLTINVARKGADATEFVIAARDATGKFVILDAAAVGVFDIKGRETPFSLLPLAESKSAEAYFAIAIDRSGSMRSEMPTVRRAASDFMQRLPKSARCLVISFNEEISRHGEGFGACDPKLARLDRLRGKGGTNLYGALVASYEALSGVEGLKAVLVITDGLGQSEITRDEVAARKNAPTHVYALGAFRQEQLENIADMTILGEKDVERLLAKYFERIAEGLAHQYVIRVPSK